MTHIKLEDLSQEELLAYATELQLRVGRFLSVEQQLINARDMLDNEVVIHKRMNTFNEKAFRVSGTKDFMSFIAESVVDIFEFEFGLAVNYQTASKALVEFACEGISIARESKLLLYKLFTVKFGHRRKGSSMVFNSDDWRELFEVIPFHQFILVNFIDVESDTGIFIAGGVLKKSAKNYSLIEKQRGNSFELFAKEVLSHFINNQKTQRISKSVNRLSSLAETFLRFGSDPMENIRAITREACQILAADLAFYKPNARNKPIYHFNHADSELNFSDEEVVFLRDVVGNSSEETAIYSNWPDTYINHLRDHHGNQENYATLCRKIRLDNQLIGVFGICFPENLMPGLEEMQIVGIIAAAIAVEEKRYLSGMDLKESEEKYRVVFDGTPHGSMIIQLPMGNIKYVNPSMCKMFGEEEEGLKKKSISDLHHEEDIIDLMESLHRTSERFNAPGQKCVTKSGKHFYADINAMPVTLAGVDYMALFYVDITERKIAQQRLEENNIELKKINSELDNFVYSVSHDLRTPLLAIKGLANLIDVEKGQLDENNHFLELIVSSVDRMDDTIKEILDYSRNSRTAITRQKIDLNKIVNDAFADMRFFTKHPVRLIADIPGDLFFESDEARINTIVKNLMGNAIKYADTSKQNSFVKISLEKKKEHILLSIEDNGEGIPPENLDHVFEMFYRASAKTTGTGLGLYITKEIVNKLGGQINIESTLGIGTTIKIALPQ